MSKASKHGGRGAARLYAVQALYQMELADTPLDAVIKEFRQHRFNAADADLSPHQTDAEVDIEYFEKIMRTLIASQTKIDRLIDAALTSSWQLTRLDSTLRAILRCAVTEILYTKDVPSATLTAQYVDMAHAFFEGAEGGMANAVLDKIAKDIKAEENTPKEIKEEIK